MSYDALSDILSYDEAYLKQFLRHICGKLHISVSAYSTADRLVESTYTDAEREQQMERALRAANIFAQKHIILSLKSAWRAHWKKKKEPLRNELRVACR